MDLYISENRDVSDRELGEHFDKLYDKEEEGLNHYFALKILTKQKQMKI